MDEASEFSYVKEKEVKKKGGYFPYVKLSLHHCLPKIQFPLGHIPSIIKNPFKKYLSARFQDKHKLSTSYTEQDSDEEDRFKVFLP